MCVQVQFKRWVGDWQNFSYNHKLKIYSMAALNQSNTAVIPIKQGVFWKISFFNSKISSLISKKKTFSFQTCSVDFSDLSSPIEATIIPIFNLSSLLEASFH